MSGCRSWDGRIEGRGETPEGQQEGPCGKSHSVLVGCGQVAAHIHAQMSAGVIRGTRTSFVLPHGSILVWTLDCSNAGRQHWGKLGKVAYITLKL